MYRQNISLGLENLGTRKAILNLKMIIENMAITDIEKPFELIIWLIVYWMLQKTSVHYTERRLHTKYVKMKRLLLQEIKRETCILNHVRQECSCDLTHHIILM